MDRSVTHSGPDAARVLTLDDLARELGLLRSRAARGTRSARVSLEAVAVLVGEPRSTIHAYIAGKRLPPAQILDRIVIALGTTPDEQREWAEAWYRVEAHRQAAHRVPGVGPARTPVPHQTPAAVGEFTGREEELTQLDEFLVHGRSGAIAAISGTAGIGKTALAVHWAQTRSQRFPDGQLYLDLHGFDSVPPMSAAHALARCLRALGVAHTAVPRETDERAALYRSLLSGRRMVIVLDNARDTEQLRPLLPGSPSCMVITTSRDSLTGLVIRHGARSIDLDVLPLGAATELLRNLIGSAPGHRELRQSDLAALAGECNQIPLALRIAAELAAGRAGTPLSELVQELAAGADELDLLEAGGDPRTALRAVFSWSYRSLPEPAARAFRTVGLHPGLDLTPTALAALTGSTVGEARRALALLARTHLLRSTGPGRYGTHSLLHSYATELAIATDSATERSAALARLVEHYLDTAAGAIELLSTSRVSDGVRAEAAGAWAVRFDDVNVARDWLDVERANLVVIAGAAADASGRTARLADFVAEFLDDDGGHHESHVVGLTSRLSARARLVGS